MTRKYVRKTCKDTDHEETLRIAVGEVLAGRCSIRKAAEKTGLPKSTVGFYTKRHYACGLLPQLKVKRLQHSTQILPASFESELADYFKDCSLVNHGLSTKETREIAYSFALANNIKVPNNWKRERESVRRLVFRVH
jgi:hypothetical protein